MVAFTANHGRFGEQEILGAADKEGNQEWVSEQESKQKNGPSRNTEISSDGGVR